MADLNLTWITEALAVGGSFASGHVPLLARELGVGAVVDLRSESCDDEHELTRHGVRFLYLPSDDHCSLSPEQLSQGVRWVVSHLSQGLRTYVHCEHGIGRSVSLCICVLIHLGHPPLRALARVKEARPCASPSPRQLQAIVDYCEASRVPAVPTWQALADIAYGRPAHCRSLDDA